MLATASNWPEHYPPIESPEGWAKFKIMVNVQIKADLKPLRLRRLLNRVQATTEHYARLENQKQFWRYHSLWLTLAGHSLTE